MYPHLSDFEKATVIEAETKARTKQRHDRATLWRCVGDLAGPLRPLLFMMRQAAKKEV